MGKVLIIAEIGVNHNGNIEYAKKLIDIAANSGADIAKFQIFKSDMVATSLAEKSNYQKNTTDPKQNQLEMIKKLELDKNSFRELEKYCHKRKIEFLATAFDQESFEYLKSTQSKRIKIPSGEINNIPFLKEVGKQKLPVLLSTGMASLGEIENAISVLESNGSKRENITVLHCTTEYPAPFTEVNLLAMKSIKNSFGIKVGYSDHTEGVEVAIAAVAIGASVIEKHITLDKSMEGPDHASSIEEDELRFMIKSIRNIEKSMGDGIKKPTISEIKNRKNARRGIYALTNIKRGEVFDKDNIVLKRPENNTPPIYWDRIIGKEAPKDFSKDESIEVNLY